MHCGPLRKGAHLSGHESLLPHSAFIAAAGRILNDDDSGGANLRPQLSTQIPVEERSRISVLSTETDDLGRPVAAFDVDLAPGETATVTARFIGADTQDGPLAVWSTPMVNTTEVAFDDVC